MLDLLPRIVHILDEPIGDPAAINTMLICAAAREAGVKVLLSGMGADELFAGYRKHLASLLGRAVPAAPAACCATGGGPRVDRLPVASAARPAVQPGGPSAS